MSKVYTETYAQLVTIAGTSVATYDEVQNFVSQHGELRESYIKEFGYYLLCRELLDAVWETHPQRRGFLEVGCGNAHLTRYIAQACPVQRYVVATDVPNDPKYGAMFENRWDKTQYMGFEEAMRTYPGRNVLIAWPSMTSWAEECLHLFEEGQTLIYIGEGPGGCNATDEFFEFIDEEFLEVNYVPIPTWGRLVSDYCAIYIKLA